MLAASPRHYLPDVVHDDLQVGAVWCVFVLNAYDSHSHSVLAAALVLPLEEKMQSLFVHARNGTPMLCCKRTCHNNPHETLPLALPLVTLEPLPVFSIGLRLAGAPDRAPGR